MSHSPLLGMVLKWLRGVFGKHIGGRNVVRRFESYSLRSPKSWTVIEGLLEYPLTVATADSDVTFLKFLVEKYVKFIFAYLVTVPVWMNR